MEDYKSYEKAVEDTWRHSPRQTAPIPQDKNNRQLMSDDEIRDIVRYATLAPSSHNTQCWKFGVTHGDDMHTTITVSPDWTRQCPIVDPDDHHLFVTLGCAVENMVLAAQAYGWDAIVDDACDPRQGIPVHFVPGVSTQTSLFEAIPKRHTDRSMYDGTPLSPEELQLLEKAGNDKGVKMVLLTDQESKENVTEYVVKGNTAQLANKQWVNELQTWVRFNESHILCHGDGLYGKSTGSPSIPRFLGEFMFPYVVSARALNKQYAQQIASSAGVAIFLSPQRDDPCQWVQVGRCFERFALQAAAMGISIAHINQPVEQADLRPAFMKALHLDESYIRADLVIRFGRGPAMPPSLRRPIDDVLE